MLEDILLIQEIELVDYVRGIDHNGDKVTEGLLILIEIRGGLWYVQTRSKLTGFTRFGSGADFHSAWTDLDTAMSPLLLTL